jgi:hypothetical protein
MDFCPAWAGPAGAAISWQIAANPFQRLSTEAAATSNQTHPLPADLLC